MSTTYRGYTIQAIGPTSFLIKELGVKFGSMWSCIAYIDERLSS